MIVDAEHQLARRRIDPHPAADHLVKVDGRLEILEEDNIPHAGHIDAGSQQIYRGGDEMAARGSSQVGKLVVAAAGRGAFERVPLLARLALLGAPVGVEVVHLRRDVVRMAVAGAKDDRLLLGAAGLQEIGEQITAHGLHPVGQQDAIFVLGLDVVFRNLLARH